MDLTKLDTNRLIAILHEYWDLNNFENAKLIDVSKFGSVILENADGVFYLICPEELSIRIIAVTDRYLSYTLKNKEFNHNWNMIGLYSIDLDKFGELKENEVFTFLMPIVLGGKCNLENVVVLNFYEVIGLAGDLSSQISNIKDGTRINIKVKSSSK